MKNTIKSIAFLFCFVGLGSSCDSDFDELNINPVAPTEVNPNYLLNHAIVHSSLSTSIFIFELAIIQQVVTPNGSTLAGGNFNQENRGRPGFWVQFYRTVLKSTMECIYATRNDESLSNLYNMARIWRAFSGMILTDTHGEVPFSKAGLGFLEGATLPEYDTQEQIYREILRELEEASAALTTSRQVFSGDVLFAGNIDKWRKFGYSLMLRAAMRLTKVDPNLAREYVTKAINGGLMQSNEDNVVIRHDANYTNPAGSWLNGTEANNYYLTANFVNFLMENNDPRLGSIAVRYVGAASGPQQQENRANRDPKVQLGMPMGYDNNSIPPLLNELGLVSFYEFSQVDRTRLAKLNSPCFLVTHAQTQLLLAEAIHRGWANGDIHQHYRNGITAHMEQMELYDENAYISSQEISNFIQSHPLESGKEMEMVNTQYWVASFLNGAEAFANFRRTGYPDLTPNPYPGGELLNEDFIRRLTYPDLEIAINQGNLSQVISRQGPDNLETRVWWDRP
ncbi:SusD/RagB family nutrient-binding outer membrane lipoprotein [Pleomorphovibrio marinus]|uniref:SusD/RagB family nutrient-binding outer membrane lipoprotein n=1 Tax=Pleomorphovibrio marinus TaxID=2164132 RepID=UPI000E0A264C|nr:SusD/RagB family nutrient-binding outer membrane lipoprotein [Pleomorphovibrio marinus]